MLLVQDYYVSLLQFTFYFFPCIASTATNFRTKRFFHQLYHKLFFSFKTTARFCLLFFVFNIFVLLPHFLAVQIVIHHLHLPSSFWITFLHALLPYPLTLHVDVSSTKPSCSLQFCLHFKSAHLLSISFKWFIKPACLPFAASSCSHNSTKTLNFQTSHSPKITTSHFFLDRRCDAIRRHRPRLPLLRPGPSIPLLHLRQPPHRRGSKLKHKLPTSSAIIFFSNRAHL